MKKLQVKQDKKYKTGFVVIQKPVLIVNCTANILEQKSISKEHSFE